MPSTDKFELEPGATVKQTMSMMRDALEAAGDINPQASAKWLIMSALELDATGLVLHSDDAVPSDSIETIESYTTRRLAGEPLQYISGVAPFRYLELDTRRGVFIPRPETEVLVDEAKSALSSLRESGMHELDGATPFRILDMCCGSGTIAVSMAYECPDCKVLACDISDTAVSLTRANAHIAGVEDRILALQGDCFSALNGVMGKTEFDLVLSNPPYVPTAKLADLPHEVVDFEPKVAFDGGEDGLDFLRRILLGLDRYLLPGGYLICELDEDALDDAIALCNACEDVRFDEIHAVDDLTGRPRVLVARRAR